MQKNPFLHYFEQKKVPTHRAGTLSKRENKKMKGRKNPSHCMVLEGANACDRSCPHVPLEFPDTGAVGVVTFHCTTARTTKGHGGASGAKMSEVIF